MTEEDGPDGGARLRLGVNIDHVATVRNARGGDTPDPARAAAMALDAGADGITAHLREDRRHIRESDLETLIDLMRTRGSHLNLEIAATAEMVEIAVRYRPHAVCLVPERREERTTEGGLDVAGRPDAIAAAVDRLRTAGARVSLFVEPTREQVEAARAAGAHVVELHTGAYCDAATPSAADNQLARLARAASEAAAQGLEVHAGHGLNFDNVGRVAAIAPVVELNIGHFLIGEAVFVGLEAAIARMRGLMDAARSTSERPA